MLASRPWEPPPGCIGTGLSLGIIYTRWTFAGKTFRINDMNKNIFKAYDIRGIYPSEINAEDVKKIAMAYAVWLKPKKVALGRDVRLSGPELWQAACDGLTEMGVDVVDLGVISTDMLYFAVANYGFDGGVTISASHNAGNYSGMKMVRAESKPISLDSGIAEIRDLALAGDFSPAEVKGEVEKLDFFDSYVTKMCSFADKDKVKPLKVVANANSGASGAAISAVAEHFGVQLTKLNFEPDGNFPKGKPDPTQASNRLETETIVKSSKVDFGAIWDADADRCFFYDEKGNFILPIYITGLMINYLLAGKTDEAVVIDPRNIWLPEAITRENNSKIVINKSGHSFIKERMHAENAIFGAETSAHYYFRDLWYTDNGMVPFVTMLAILSKSDKPLSELVKALQDRFFVIEEANFKVVKVAETIEKISSLYSKGKLDNLDGVSIEFDDWRMNLRGSNTEPVIRLNIEAKSAELANEKLTELTEVIGGKKV